MGNASITFDCRGGVIGVIGVMTLEGDMETATSKLTKKYQATIPEPIRRHLQLSAGDSIAFDIEGDEIHVRKARPIDLAYARGLEGTLGEWASEADDEAYRDL